MPGGAHPEELAQSGHLAGWTQTADLRNVDADEINQALLMRGTYSCCVLNNSPMLGRARLLAQQAEMIMSSGGSGSSRKTSDTVRETCIG